MNISQAIDILLKKDSMFNQIQAFEYFIKYYSYNTETIVNPIKDQIGTPCESHFREIAWKTIYTHNLKITLDFKIKKRQEKTTDKEVQHRGRLTDISYTIMKTGISKTFFLDSTNPNSLRENLDKFADALKEIEKDISSFKLEQKELVKFNKSLKEKIPKCYKDKSNIRYSNQSYSLSLKNLSKEEIEKVIAAL